MVLGREMILDAGPPESRHNLQIVERQRPLRGLDAGDLDVFDDILPRLVEWKSGN